MNIFVLNIRPEKAAADLCDKHVVKMLLETAQMLCSPFEEGVAPYKRAYYNHPCTAWVRQRQINYDWLLAHGQALCMEYTNRFKKVHKSEQVIQWCYENDEQLKLERSPWEMTPFALAMPDKYKQECPVESYRAYYIGEKMDIAEWNHGPRPSWLEAKENN